MTTRPTSWTYETLRQLVADEALPVMLVDTDALDRNTRRLAALAADAGKTLRVASKSIRVPALIRRVLDVGAPTLRGLMCFGAAEAAFLHGEGFDDLLIAYPTVQAPDLERLWSLRQQGATVSLMVDSVAHVTRLQSWWADRLGGADEPRLPVCIDVDMSYRPLRALDPALGPHLGVQRSPVRDLDQFRTVLAAAQSATALEVHGVMGYEAQIAGLGESNPFTPLLNPVKRLLKIRSAEDVAERRHAVRRCLDDAGLSGVLFNGGGTGSLRTTTQEPWLTEVTAGSGFLQSHLFDYYDTNQYEPACFFALQVTRAPQEDLVTCQSGGFIASGEAGPDKAPVVMLPRGLEPLSAESFGEVQTPLKVPPGVHLGPGDPVFCRPAKAGEIAERFNDYLLIADGRITDRVKTYRGLGHCFY